METQCHDDVVKLTSNPTMSLELQLRQGARGPMRYGLHRHGRQAMAQLRADIWFSLSAPVRLLECMRTCNWSRSRCTYH